MAPARHSRRAQPSQTQDAPVGIAPSLENGSNADVNQSLFLDFMMGTPLAIYIEKDVDDRAQLSEIVVKHGGSIAPGYSGVSYILVDPLKESGQNLFRQYVGKKGKIVLDSRWVLECVKAGALQTYHSNWAGCKVTGQEKLASKIPSLAVIDGLESTSLPPAQTVIPAQTQARRQSRPSQIDPLQMQGPIPLQAQQQPLQQSQPVSPSAMDPLRHVPPTFSYPVYSPTIHQPERVLHPASATSPQTWQTTGSIAPQQTHMPVPPPHLLRPTPEYREETPWDASYDHTVQPAAIPGPPSSSNFDYRYREEGNWGSNEFYEPAYDPTFEQPPPFVSESPAASSSAVTLEATEKSRGRKRTRNQPQATPAVTLVMTRQNPPARSPTPPTRVIKSTYGGNLFTSDDIIYLKKYIDYCQEQGLVLSLREICERIAVKAPHHTFYSWRRYCNKHQIRLGGYAMTLERSPSPGHDNGQVEAAEIAQAIAGPGPGSIEAVRQTLRESDGQSRDRSPTPPRALFRSTTGKGVAFTQEDITFLMRFMEYRKSQNRLDMVAFWKDVAVKAPHHSRASWMKFWRRHKHELSRSEGDEPLPQPPEKKMRYSREDDILLAKYFYDKPEGTSDKIFQAFGRMHSHHPWKGWQEHYRIHKAEIEHIIQRLANGEDVEGAEPIAE